MFCGGSFPAGSSFTPSALRAGRVRRAATDRSVRRGGRRNEPDIPLVWHQRRRFRSAADVGEGDRRQSSVFGIGRSASLSGRRGRPSGGVRDPCRPSWSILRWDAGSSALPRHGPGAGRHRGRGPQLETVGFGERTSAAVAVAEQCAPEEQSADCPTLPARMHHGFEAISRFRRCPNGASGASDRQFGAALGEREPRNRTRRHAGSELGTRLTNEVEGFARPCGQLEREFRADDANRWLEAVDGSIDECSSPVDERCLCHRWVGHRCWIGHRRRHCVHHRSGAVAEQIERWAIHLLGDRERIALARDTC